MVENKNRATLIFAIIAAIIVVACIFTGTYLVIQDDKNHPKTIEVCDGVSIATANANSDLCFTGCVEYKGQFVNYDTLRYVQEQCKDG